jgi:predicted amino acid racemase
MFLDALQERNPRLVDAVLELHREGVLPPGSFVVDLDTVARNAAAVAAAAERLGIRLYFMTKQVGRNPAIARTALEYIPAAVAVDVDDADALAAAGVPLGHVGHLVQPPSAALERVLSYRPEVLTVYSVGKAEQVSAVAEALGIEQALTLRVTADGDEVFPGQEGGIALSELIAARRTIDESLPAVRVAGVTSYPTVAFSDGAYAPTRNLGTLEAAARTLGDLEQVNAAGHTSVDTLPIVAASGATHAEPGHALTGTTPRTAVAQTAEVPAVCFLSEVSHFDDDDIWVFGGGFYARGHAASGLLSHGGSTSRLALRPQAPEFIDYYRRLARDGQPVAVGDAAVFAFRFQAFATRAPVATLAGVQEGRPRLVGVHDVQGRPVLAQRAAHEA